MKKLFYTVWWLVLLALASFAGLCFIKMREFGQAQEQQIMAIGQDIAARPDNWKTATIGDYDAFHWWKNLDVGHGMTSLATNTTIILLAGIVLHLAISLIVIQRKKNKTELKEQHNNVPEDTARKLADPQH